MRGEHGSPQRQVRPQEFNKPRSEGRLRRGCNGCLVEVYMAHKSGCHSSSQKIPKLAGKSPEIDAFLRRAIYCWMFFGARFCFFGGSWFSAFLASLLFLLLCFSAVCFPCFFAFSAFLLSLLLCVSAFVLLCLSTSTILLFLFFSHVMCLCCSTSCFSASCLYCLFVFHFLWFLLSCLYPK